MPLLVYFVGLFLALRKSQSISLLLIGTYALSLLGACLINRDYPITNWTEFFNLLFLGFILTIFTFAWKPFKTSTNIVFDHSKKREKKLDRIANFLLITCGISTVILTYGFVYTYTSISDYEAFKNGDEGYNFIKNSLPINSFVYFVSQYFSAGAYFLIPFHFYYINKGRGKKSLLCFIFSLSLILSGLVVFSRSNIVLFLAVYIFNFCVYYKNLNKKIIKRVKRIALIFIGIIVIAFTAITFNRFGDSTDKSGYQGIGGTIDRQSFVTNPVLYSLIDYPCQWYENGSQIINEYNFETKEYKGGIPVLIIIGDKTGITDNYMEKTRIEDEKVWPFNFFLFNGIVALLLYDLGYLGTVIFALAYCYVVRLLRPHNNNLNYYNTLFMGVLFVLPVMGIFGFWLRNPFYNFAIIYGLIFYIYLRKK